MTPRPIRRAQERKARKEMERKARKEAERKAKNLGIRAEELVTTATETDELDFDPPVISEAKLQANRANAQLSTGPKSAETKAKTSLNAVKAGLIRERRIGFSAVANHSCRRAVIGSMREARRAGT